MLTERLQCFRYVFRCSIGSIDGFNVAIFKILNTYFFPAFDVSDKNTNSSRCQGEGKLYKFSRGYRKMQGATLHL